MITECTPEQLEFHVPGRREVIGKPDGGGVLLREVEKGTSTHRMYANQLRL